MEFLPRLEYISKTLESTLISTREAEEEITRKTRLRVKEFLQRSLRARSSVKLGSQIVIDSLLVLSAIFPNDSARKIGDAGLEIKKEEETADYVLKQKFDRAIIKIDAISVNKLMNIMKILQKYPLEDLVEYILAEPIQVQANPKRNVNSIDSM